MDEITSSEFRRSYATLKRRTVVTVLGRPIGIWDPYIVKDGTGHVVDISATEYEDAVRRVERPPFTPVPKKGK